MAITIPRGSSALLRTQSVQSDRSSQANRACKHQKPDTTHTPFWFERTFALLRVLLDKALSGRDRSANNIAAKRSRALLYDRTLF